MSNFTLPVSINAPRSEFPAYRKVLNKNHRKNKVYDNVEVLKDGYWHQEQFLLERSTLFRSFSLEQQHKILTKLSDSIIEEIYFIENAGMNFSNKMSLLSESVEEKQMYSFFAAQEAQHFHWLTEHCNFQPADSNDNPFVGFINDTIDNASRMQLKLIIQVFLEGWGIDYYKGLISLCKSESLKSVFKAILKDEADHHYSGVQSFSESTLSPSEYSELLERLTVVLQMVQAGPQSILTWMSSIDDGYAKNQLIQLLEELDAIAITQKKLNQLKNLLLSAKATSIVEKLERRRLFIPYSSESVIRIFEGG